jgi:hypothetical protein
MIELTKKTLWLSIFWEVVLVFITIIGYSYYVPKGFRTYYYIVCFAPMVLGLLLSISCIAKFVIYGPLN